MFEGFLFPTLCTIHIAHKGLNYSIVTNRGNGQCVRYLHSVFLSAFVSPFLYCPKDRRTRLCYNTTEILCFEGSWGRCKVHESSLQMPKSNLRAQHCWSQGVPKEVVDAPSLEAFKATGHPTPKENICKNISKTAVCILLKRVCDGGQEIWEKWADFSKAQDAVIIHLLCWVICSGILVTCLISELLGSEKERC